MDGIIIGKFLVAISSEDPDIPDEEYELEEIQEILDKVRDKMGETLDDIPPKIYMGTKNC